MKKQGNRITGLQKRFISRRARNIFEKNNAEEMNKLMEYWDTIPIAKIVFKEVIKQLADYQKDASNPMDEVRKMLRIVNEELKKMGIPIDTNLTHKIKYKYMEQFVEIGKSEYAGQEGFYDYGYDFTQTVKGIEPPNIQPIIDVSELDDWREVDVIRTIKNNLSVMEQLTLHGQATAYSLNQMVNLEATITEVQVEYDEIYHDALENIKARYKNKGWVMKAEFLKADALHDYNVAPLKLKLDELKAKLHHWQSMYRLEKHIFDMFDRINYIQEAGDK